MKIKICGMKNAVDSLAACAAGADLLGFNFYEPSPRYLPASAIREIVGMVQRQFPEVLCVGVFVNHSPAEVARQMAFCGLDLAQLAGDEHMVDYGSLAGRAYKSLRPQDQEGLDDAVKQLLPRTPPPAFLLDAYKVGMYGGSGETGDWELARAAAAEHDLLLAGGLTPENVADAILRVRPWGVDVASGVERSRGEKDVNRIAAFIHAARQASQMLRQGSDV